MVFTLRITFPSFSEHKTYVTRDDNLMAVIKKNCGGTGKLISRLIQILLAKIVKSVIRMTEMESWKWFRIF